MRTPVGDLEYVNLDENTAINTLEQNKDLLDKLNDREKSLTDIATQCKELEQQSDVSPLAQHLLAQLTITIQILREHILLYTTHINVLEQHLQQLRDQPASIHSQNTIDSSPMPEEDIIHTVDVEQQTSFPLQRQGIVDTLDTSVQTIKERKPTENIMVTQTISDGHETIKFESVPNPSVPEKVEDVFVDAKYKQPGEPTRTSELVLRNVPQSFETTFVEPDETTTEVVVDPDGTKRIIVRKLTRTRQQVVQQHQQFTTVSTLVGSDNIPVTQSITQLNMANQRSATTISGAGGTTTTVTKHAKGSLAAGSAPDNLVIQETFETEPELERFEYAADDVTLQGVTMHEGDVAFVDGNNFNRLPTPEPLVTEPGFEQSSIRAVVQQVTRRIIRRTRKIIKRIVIIDGKEHVTEEVVEEPEEIEISEEDVPNVNVHIEHSRDGRIITQETHGDSLVQMPSAKAQTTNIVTIVESSLPVTFTKEEIVAATTSAIEIPSADEQIEEIEVKPAESTSDEKIVIAEQSIKQEDNNETLKQDQEQKLPEPELIQETKEDVQVLELVSAPVEIVDSAPTVNVTHIELAAANVSDVPEESIQIEITENAPEIKNIEDIWPLEHHIRPLDIEISHKQPIESTIVEHQLPEDKEIAKEIWPTNLNTGSPFQLEEYQFEATVRPTIVHIQEEIIEVPQQDAPIAVEITVDSPQTETDSVAVVRDDINVSTQDQREKAEAPVESQERIKETLDIRSVTQMFIDNELNTSDATTRTIKVTLPSKGTQSPGSVSVTMKVEPTEQATVNVNLVEEGAMAGQSEYDDKSSTGDSKRSRKKRKKKDKTPVPTSSIDSSVEQSIELDIDDDNTISEQLEMPEIVATPISQDELIKREQEAKISPDESYKTIPELEGAVKIIEESVISSPSDSPKPIATELVITTDVVEAKLVEDVEQQTSPVLNISGEEAVRPVVEVRSAHTSPQSPPVVINVSLQTTPEPETKTAVEIVETEVQTSPVQAASPTDKQPIEVSTEEVQTENTNVPQIESSVQTIVIETKEQELQTTPKDSPRKEIEIVQSSDVVPHVTDTIVADIIRDLPLTIPTAHESTNTEHITTIETVTQTIEQSPRLENDDTSIATTSSEPYEIHIEASVTIPDDESTSAEIDQQQPVVVEISKTYIVDETKPGGVEEVSTTYQETPAAGKKKKNKKKKNKNGKDAKAVDINVSVDQGPPIAETKEFLAAEQYMHHAAPVKKSEPISLVQPQPSAPSFEIIETVATPQTPDVQVNIVTEIVQQQRPELITPENEPSIETNVDAAGVGNQPQFAQLEIIKKTEYCEPVTLLFEENPVLEETSIVTAALPTSEIESSSVTTDVSSESQHEVAGSAESHSSNKPNRVQLSITTTTVYDTLTPAPERASSEMTNWEITTTETPVEEKPIAPKRSKQRATSSVTIEEVMSPTEEIDVPLTPGLDTAEQYERAPETIWSSKLMLNRPAASSASTEDFIAAESSANVAPVATVTKHQSVAQWHHTNDAITDRIRNINNVRNARLSNVLHLATLSEKVTEESAENRVQIVDDNLNELRQAIETREIVIIQRTVITVIETISTWLETIEYRVYLNRQNSSEGPSEDKVQQLNELNKELAGINESVRKLSSQLQLAAESIPPADKQRMATCFENLKEQVQAVETVTKDNSSQAVQDLRRWNEYTTIVHTITVYITNLQQKFENILSQDDTPIDTKLQQLDDLENENRQQMRDISKVIHTARALMRDFPSKQLPQDVYNTYEASRALENAIVLERSKLLELLSLAEDYEQTLREFEQITLLADALVDQPINVATLDDLQQEMQKHRKFFINLSHCKAILDKLQENLDPDSRVKHADLHKTLYDRASNILEKAAERAQKISLAASRWTVLERGMRDERQWLQVAEQRVPDLSEVTSADYDRYITLYQSLSTDINNHHAKILQLIKIAAQLQELVNAAHLEEENNDSLAILLILRDEVTLYSRRLHTFREIWSIYEVLTDKLEIWIKQAERDLAAIEVPKDLRTQPIENMRQFWEIKAHYEMHNNIRNDLANQFEKAVEILPIADVVLQRQFHGQLESRWYAVSKKINDIQNAIVNSLSDQELPINDKLKLFKRELEEIQFTITSNKSIIKNEEELSLYIERMQVLNSRIGIIDNELGKIGMLPSSEPEQIGELFALSHRINSQIAEELENATNLRDRLLAIQQGISRVQKSQQNNSAILDECESHEKLGSEQIEMAIIECQDVKEDLVEQWQEIMRLRQLLHALPMRLRVSVSPIKLERDLSHLQDEHALLETRCAHILSLLKNRLMLWRRFERQLEIVQQSVHETDYMVDILKVNGQVDYERLKKATERLEVSFHITTFNFSID